MQTSILIEQLLRDVRFAVAECKKESKESKVVIQMAPDTHYDVWEHLHGHGTGWHDTGQETPDNFKKYFGCPIEIEESWSWGVAVKKEVDDVSSGT